ncbi:gas vesicle protein GvpN [Fictibacillus fluitans]|uniref:Gas vesicle protein GvpN n=1 Tax=Fictibacillus fluitans TaxID=3058422 RepID=A0ABT8HWU1_9BACL|nr:gas vesicle protein GvpN [Fictibacillus sp. NE201]MDN4524945.1 gas vesicle protein GvpN [Fictibacillus sp. NE201]
MMNQQDEFLAVPFYQSLVSRSLMYLRTGFPVHFTGPSGVGKTSLAFYIAKQMDRPVTVIRGHHELSNKDLIGHYMGITKKEVVDNYIHSVYKKEQEVRPLWMQGQLIEAVKKGHVVIYDEFTRSRPETNNILLSLLEERVLPVYGNGKFTAIPCHPDFCMIFTSNPEEYAGTFHTQDALIDRLITIGINLCDEQSEMAIIRKKTGVNEKEAASIVQFVNRLRAYGNGSSPSLRAAIMIASIAKKASVEICPKNLLYQQLCLDVLTRHVQPFFPDEEEETVQELILQELQREDEPE